MSIYQDYIKSIQDANQEASVFLRSGTKLNGQILQADEQAIIMTGKEQGTTQLVMIGSIASITLAGQPSHWGVRGEY